MRQFISILITFLALAACNNSTEKHPDTQSGIKIFTGGPKGSGYTDSTGKNFGIRLFRTHIINDTIIPVELIINFPSDSVALRPTDSRASLGISKSDRYVRVFLFPSSMTPDKQEEVYNYGITELESFLDTGLNKPTMRKIIIQPKQDYILYIGSLQYPAFGRARAKLFMQGQNLFYRISDEPPLDSALIPCGQIVFKK